MDDFANARNATPLPHGLTELTFDTKVQALFPGDDVWKLMDPWATEKANLRDLFSHVTGGAGYALNAKMQLARTWYSCAFM